MAKNDFSLLMPPSTGTKTSTHQYLVAPGTTSSINAGEFVYKPLGSGAGNYAKAMFSGSSTQPVLASDYIAGFAMSTSTENSTATGLVEVMEVTPDMVFLGNPATAANFGLTTGSLSQATYNAQVGKRVLIQGSSGVFTVLTTDGSSNGVVVEYVDVTQFPKVAFSLRAGLNYKFGTSATA